MRNIKVYLNKPKGFNPILKFRYGQGLGDFISAILHSKLIGPLTYLVTGVLEPCQTCNNRRIALNILFPIPFWRFFFKTEEDMEKSLNFDYRKNGIIWGENDFNKNDIPEEPKIVETIISMDELIK